MRKDGADKDEEGDSRKEDVSANVAEDTTSWKENKGIQIVQENVPLGFLKNAGGALIKLSWSFIWPGLIVLGIVILLLLLD